MAFLPLRSSCRFKSLQILPHCLCSTFVKPKALFFKARCFMKKSEWANDLFSLQQAHELIARHPKTTQLDIGLKISVDKSENDYQVEMKDKESWNRKCREFSLNEVNGRFPDFLLEQFICNASTKIFFACLHEKPRIPISKKRRAKQLFYKSHF